MNKKAESSSTDLKLMKSLVEKLESWYSTNGRNLPWRASRDPYRVWISEVMLQQTTVPVASRYFERFLALFPTVDHLSSAPIADVLGVWSGLGYYSRARNLHKSAQALSKGKFPKTHNELLSLPGFGPYTSRAVSSISFGEAVGVLDGNVIRILTRVFGHKFQWWKSEHKKALQQESDQLASLAKDPGVFNQAMMDLGATTCTTSNPTCVVCPWITQCKANQQQLQTKIPLKKPRPQNEIWEWKVLLIKKDSRFAMVKNDQLPFLKGQLTFPGSAKRLKSKPKKYLLKHQITKHSIYVQGHRLKANESLDLIKLSSSRNPIKWIQPEKMASVAPSIVMQKILQAIDDTDKLIEC